MRYPAICIALLVLLCLPLIAIKIDYPIRASSDIASVHAIDSRRDYTLILDELHSRADALQRELGIYTTRSAQIYIIDDPDLYKALSLGKNSIVEFSDAFYSSAEERIYIRSREQISGSYHQVIYHEYLHWLLDQLFESAPLWFHEGMATYYSGQLGYDRYLSFIRASFWGESSDLFLLSFSYPEDQQDWDNYYLSSYFALKWMRDKNPQSWKRFWDHTAGYWRRGYRTDFISAFRVVYGQSLWSFNQTFRAYTRSLATQYLVIGINSLILAMLPAILIIAYRIRRKRRLALPDLPIPEDDLPEEDEAEIEDTEKPDYESRADN